MFIPPLGNSPETKNLSVFVPINVSSDWYLFLNAVWVIFSSISLPPMCKISYRIEKGPSWSVGFKGSMLHRCFSMMNWCFQFIIKLNF